MAKILIYNNNSNRMEIYYRGLSEAMPYITNRTLTVREFRANSSSNILWTSTNTMIAWNNFRSVYGRSIFVGFAFKRCWEGGHGNQSQHYAGTAFYVGQNLSYSGRLVLRNLAASSGIWTYVEPINLTPRWVHFDQRTTASGYPTIRYGNIGNYVCTCQDALNTLGYSTGGLDGIFGSNTRNAVLTFQNRNSLSSDGIMGPLSWSRLMSQVNGIGRANTVIN
jgi:hypothetical protein